MTKDKNYQSKIGLPVATNKVRCGRSAWDWLDELMLPFEKKDGELIDNVLNLREEHKRKKFNEFDQRKMSDFYWTNSLAETIATNYQLDSFSSKSQINTHLAYKDTFAEIQKICKSEIPHTTKNNDLKIEYMANNIHEKIQGEVHFERHQEPEEMASHNVGEASFSPKRILESLRRIVNHSLLGHSVSGEENCVVNGLSSLDIDNECIPDTKTFTENDTRLGHVLDPIQSVRGPVSLHKSLHRMVINATMLLLHLQYDHFADSIEEIFFSSRPTSIFTIDMCRGGLYALVVDTNVVKSLVAHREKFNCYSQNEEYIDYTEINQKYAVNSRTVDQNIRGPFCHFCRRNSPEGCGVRDAPLTNVPNTEPNTMPSSTHNKYNSDTRARNHGTRNSNVLVEKSLSHGKIDLGVDVLGESYPAIQINEFIDGNYLVGKSQAERFITCCFRKAPKDELRKNRSPNNSTKSGSIRCRAQNSAMESMDTAVLSEYQKLLGSMRVPTDSTISSESFKKRRVVINDEYIGPTGSVSVVHNNTCTLHYCSACLTSFSYNLPSKNTTWKCPVCDGTCICSRCNRNKSMKNILSFIQENIRYVDVDRLASSTENTEWLPHFLSKESSDTNISRDSYSRDYLYMDMTGGVQNNCVTCETKDYDVNSINSVNANIPCNKIDDQTVISGTSWESNTTSSSYRLPSTTEKNSEKSSEKAAPEVSCGEGHSTSMSELLDRITKGYLSPLNHGNPSLKEIMSIVNIPGRVLSIEEFSRSVAGLPPPSMIPKNTVELQSVFKIEI